jgi:CRISPR/Cas system CSM-associated protein Csm3 (group 7 of RAMP superfamily)
MKEKKIKERQPNQFALNRGQIEKLAKMAAHFKEVEWFILGKSTSSGIGPTVVVKFNLFNDSNKDIDTTVDITDVSTW